VKRAQHQVAFDAQNTKNPFMIFGAPKICKANFSVFHDVMGSF
jgi:hypothetical protein